MSRAIVEEFTGMAHTVAAGGSLSREQQARVVRYALHASRSKSAAAYSELADEIGPDIFRLIRDPRAVRMNFACALLDQDCNVLAAWEGSTEKLEAAEDLALAAITDGGTGTLHAKPND